MAGFICLPHPVLKLQRNQGKAKDMPLAFLSSLLVTGGSPPDFNLFLSTLWHILDPVTKIRLRESEIFLSSPKLSSLGVNLIQ